MDKINIITKENEENIETPEGPDEKFDIEVQIPKEKKSEENDIVTTKDKTENNKGDNFLQITTPGNPAIENQFQGKKRAPERNDDIMMNNQSPLKKIKIDPFIGQNNHNIITNGIKEKLENTKKEQEKKEKENNEQIKTEQEKEDKKEQEEIEEKKLEEKKEENENNMMMDEKPEEIITNIEPHIEEVVTPQNINKKILDYYTCIKCDFPVKIINYDLEKNKLELKCINQKEHGLMELTIKDYCQRINSNFNSKVCCQCKNNLIPISYYCLDCAKYLCNNCYDQHKKNLNHEKLIKYNELNIKCLKHINENYLMYCYDCKNNICSKCIQQKEHLNHRKDLLSEIEPSDLELNDIKNMKEEMVQKRKNLIEEKIKLEKLIKAVEEGIELNDLVINTYEKYRYNYMYIYNVKNFSKNVTKYFSVQKKYNDDNKIIKTTQFSLSNNKGYKNLRNHKNNKIMKFPRINTNNNLNDNSAYIIEHKKLDFSTQEKISREDLSDQDDNSKKEEDNKIFNEENEDNELENNIEKDSEDEKEEEKEEKEEEEEIEAEEIDQKKLNEFNEKYIKNKKVYLSGKETLINISNKEINDEGLENFIAIKSNIIQKLNISTNKISHIISLKDASFKYLKYLDLSANNIEDINNLYKVPFLNLEGLQLSNCNITSIYFLIQTPFNKLKILDLSNNPIKDIDLLNKTNFENLTNLNLNNNQIKNIDFLGSVPFGKLVKLSLKENNIISLGVFEDVPFNKLKELDLSGNKIKSSNIVVFIRKNSLKNLEMINLKNNPLLNDKDKKDNINAVSKIVKKVIF